jgi:hypothetical protein
MKAFSGFRTGAARAMTRLGDDIASQQRRIAGSTAKMAKAISLLKKGTPVGVGVAAVLLGISLAALWTMPPFWAPLSYGGALVLILLRHALKGRLAGQGLWKTSAANTVVLLFVSGLGLVGSYLSFEALRGRALPDGDVVDIAAPFGPGHYLIASGGSTPTINPHLKTLEGTVERFIPFRGQSKALDIFRIGPLGLHKHGWQPVEPDRYTTFGTPVLAPCRGRVARVVDGIRDMPVPQMDRDHMAGNHVAIDCGEAFVILAHFRQGSITVALNERVDAGDPLGQMGNSGNSSEPHLHVHAQRGLPESMPLGGEPLWLTINGRFVVRNDRIEVP